MASGVSNLRISWKYWKSQFFHFLLSWKYGKLKSPLFLGSWKYRRRAGGGGRAAPGVVLCCLGLFLGPCSWNFATCPISGNNTVLRFGVILDPFGILTPTTTRQQLSHLARHLDHHAQGPNIPFGESLTSTYKKN